MTDIHNLFSSKWLLKAWFQVYTSIHDSPRNSYNDIKWEKPIMACRQSIRELP